MFSYTQSLLNILLSIIVWATVVLAVNNSTFSCSYTTEGVVNSNEKSTNWSSVKPWEYKCTNAIFVNSDSMILWTLSTVLANLISIPANVDFPSTPSS